MPLFEEDDEPPEGALLPDDLAGRPALPGALTPGPAPPPRPSTAPACVSHGPLGSPVALLLAVCAPSSPKGSDAEASGLTCTSTPTTRARVIRQTTNPATRLRRPRRRG